MKQVEHEKNSPVGELTRVRIQIHFLRIVHVLDDVEFFERVLLDWGYGTINKHVVGHDCRNCKNNQKD